MKRWKLKNKENTLKINTVFGIIVGLIGVICGLWLLIFLEKISGAEFVALSLGFAVLGLIIAFAAEVQEFSIAGNGVKLKELRSEAEKTIEGLKEARIELFRVLVQKSVELSGGYYVKQHAIKRTNDFISLFENIEKFDCTAVLKDDLLNTLYEIMIREYKKLSFIHKKDITQDYKFSFEDKPDNLFVVLTDETINGMQDVQNKNFQDAKIEVIQDIHRYSKLYAIKVKLDKLETDNAQTHLLRSRLTS